MLASYQLCNYFLFSTCPTPPCILATVSSLRHLKSRTGDTRRTRETWELVEPSCKGRRWGGGGETTILMSVTQSPVRLPNQSDAQSPAPLRPLRPLNWVSTTCGQIPGKILPPPLRCLILQSENRLGDATAHLINTVCNQLPHRDPLCAQLLPRIL